MEKTPKVSVVIPVYNAAEYLRQGLDCILNQSLTELEVICVDDESPDNSLEILREYAARDPRVVVLEQKNQGAGAARNHGLEHARGTYVHFMDADDYVAENAYSAMYYNAVRFDADVIKTRAYAVDDDTGELVESKTYTLDGLKDEDYYRVTNFAESAQMLVRYISVVPWNGIYKREFLLKHGIRFNGLKCVNDRSFYNHVITRAERVVVIPDRTVYHRVNIGTSLVGQRAKHFECHFESYKIIEEQCAHLSEEDRLLILTVEMNGIFYWYRKFKNDEQLGETVRRQMREFLDTQDLAFFLQNQKNPYWKKDWLEVVEASVGTGRKPSERKLSVVIPVYNAAAYLRQGLDSILSQSLTELEVICVDDESTDNSLEILHEYAARDSRVVVLQQKNAGAGAARNKGIDAAKGEYIHFLDADDYVAEGAYEAMYASAVQYDADMIKCKARGIDEVSGEAVAQVKYDMVGVEEDVFYRVTNFSQMPEILTKYVAVVPWNGIYRTAFLREHQIRFCSLFCVNDRSFYNHVLLCAQRIVLLPVISVCHRVNLSTSLVGQRIKHFDCHFQSYRITEELCRNQPERFRAIMMRAELNDTLVWFKRYRDDPEYGPGITRQMCEFLNTIDIEFFHRNRVDIPARNVWMELIPEAKSRLMNKTGAKSETKKTTKTSGAQKSQTAKEQHEIDAVEKCRADREPVSLRKDAVPDEQRDSAACVAGAVPSVSADALAAEIKFYQEELERVCRSRSYRIGRAVTWLPRKVLGGIRCYQEHGLRYTLRRVKEQFLGLFGMKFDT